MSACCEPRSHRSLARYVVSGEDGPGSTRPIRRCAMWCRPGAPTARRALGLDVEGGLDAVESSRPGTGHNSARRHDLVALEFSVLNADRSAGLVPASGASAAGRDRARVRSRERRRRVVGGGDDSDRGCPDARCVAGVRTVATGGTCRCAADIEPMVHHTSDKLAHVTRGELLAKTSSQGLPSTLQSTAMEWVP